MGFSGIGFSGIGWKRITSHRSNAILVFVLVIGVILRQVRTILRRPGKRYNHEADRPEICGSMLPGLRAIGLHCVNPRNFI